MTSSNGNIFRVTGSLCGESTGPHKDLWRGALMFSLICAWTNGWTDNQNACDLRRHCAHYDVTQLKPSRTKFVVTLVKICRKLTRPHWRWHSYAATDKVSIGALYLVSIGLVYYMALVQLYRILVQINRQCIFYSSSADPGWAILLIQG